MGIEYQIGFRGSARIPKRLDKCVGARTIEIESTNTRLTLQTGLRAS